VVRHLAGIAEIVEDVESAARFYREVLGLTVEYQEGQGYANVHVPGVLHFGLWSRAAAAESTFGTAEEAERIPLGFTVGFEVDEVEPASGEMVVQGWRIVQPAKTEPWGQVTSRFFSPSGALCEVSETPWARRLTENVQAESEG